ncbi:2-keto-myo-inositol isomerase [Vreelandella subterranea]|uniref:2-keto-myo-inositol isomerase n=1 Tax=Vreelandella subterranea TaxID=416874 RepID=A0A1H9PGG3_9GAMM|nr:TIM barrel protein [Halomonas subterranea]SER47312.1 2-keto-myo-inositol isomerase [Halomonas subterranea]
MVKQSPMFSLNHMVNPRWSPQQLIEAAVEMGVGAVELRNDVGANSILDLDAARRAGELAHEMGIHVLSINALYPFNVWNDERASQAEALAQQVYAAGGHGLVLCPLVDADTNASGKEKQANLEQALSALDIILGRYNIQGFVEPLGFPISTLRTKREVVDAIKALNLGSRFSLVHDTFHHKGAGETEFFTESTGLVHISGLDDSNITFEDMLDDHRVLVGGRDRLDNVAQLRQLLSEGYEGYISFEPFAKSVHTLEDPIAELRDSMAFIQSSL